MGANNADTNTDWETWFNIIVSRVKSDEEKENLNWSMTLIVSALGANLFCNIESPYKCRYAAAATVIVLLPRVGAWVIQETVIVMSMNFYDFFALLEFYSFQ